MTTTPPDLIIPTCSGCGTPARLVARLTRIRRRDQILAFDSWSWECPGDCADPFTGEHPFRFADPPLLRWEDEQARELWEQRFGRPMPPSERGRHPGPHRTVRVPLMLTPAEAAKLDAARGDLSRSEYLRQHLGDVTSPQKG